MISKIIVTSKSIKTKFFIFDHPNYDCLAQTEHLYFAVNGENKFWQFVRLSGKCRECFYEKSWFRTFISTTFTWNSSLQKATTAINTYELNKHGFLLLRQVNKLSKYYLCNTSTSPLYFLDNKGETLELNWIEFIPSKIFLQIHQR